MPALRRVRVTMHCGIGDRMHCGAAVRMADNMGHRIALWTVRRIAAEIAEGITRGAQEGEMNPAGQVTMTWPVSAVSQLAVLYSMSYTSPVETISAAR